MTDLNILDLLSPQYSVIHWTALLIEHRSFRKDSAVAVGGGANISTFTFYRILKPMM